MFEMTDEEFMECEVAEAKRHDEKIRELTYEKNMDIDISVDDDFENESSES